MSVIVYGIKNCNTVKAALDWLDRHEVEFEFHDFKSRGVSELKLVEWCAQKGWETLVNKRGNTWRQLDASIQESIRSQATAVALMKDKTSVIKRPVIEFGGKILALGFDAEVYSVVVPR